MLFAAPDTTMKEAITAEHQLFEKHANSVNDSWHQVGFTSGSGLTGQHMSYIERRTKDGNQTLRQLHNFVFQRKDGRLVSVSYMGPAGDNADAIEQMIERSLKLQ
jgi:hypothetical protein